MPNYDFWEDLKEEKKSELEMVSGLEKNYGAKRVGGMSENSDWDVELLLKDGSKITVEFKEDWKWSETGHTVVEYECRGKPSGIKVSKADFYIYRLRGSPPEIPHRHYIFKTSRLKWIKDNNMYKDIKVGGDKGSQTKMYRLTVDEFIKWGKELDLSI